MLDNIIPILILLLVGTSAVSYSTVTPHLPTKFPNACSQEAIDKDSTGLVAKMKTFGILSFVVSSLSLGLFLLLMIFADTLSPVTLFSIVYLAILALLRKRFITAWRSDRPKYQLIEEIEENSTLIKFGIMFIAIGPFVVPLVWSFVAALPNMISMGSGL